MENKTLVVTDLIENRLIWKIEVTKGTKKIPVGVYALYSMSVFANKEKQSLSFKTAFELLQKGKAVLIKNA